MTRKQNRAIWIAAIGLVLMAAVGLTLFALKDGIAFALSPAELEASTIKPGDRVRLFGLVKKDSVQRGDGLNVAFTLTLEGAERSVVFNDLLPDLFREEQGIIAEGSLDNRGVFVADTVLAKHDENYIPKEFADKLKEDGMWRDPSDDAK